LDGDAVAANEEAASAHAQKSSLHARIFDGRAGDTEVKACRKNVAQVGIQKLPNDPSCSLDWEIAHPSEERAVLSAA